NRLSRPFIGRLSFSSSIPRHTVLEKIPTVFPSIRNSTTTPSLVARIRRQPVRQQTIFVVLGSFFVFTWAAISTNLETDEWVARLTRGQGSRTWPNTIRSVDLKRAADISLAQELRDNLKKLADSTEGLPNVIRNFVVYGYGSVAQAYLNVTDGKRLCWKIGLLNVGVWLAWRSNGLRSYMQRNFAHDVLSGKSRTLLTSILSSRYSVVLLLNLLFLDGFGSSSSFHMTKRMNESIGAPLEATSAYHFLAFFVSAGLFSGLVSHIVHLKIIYPRMIARLSRQDSHSASRPDTWAAALRTANAPTPRLRLLRFFRRSEAPENPSLMPRAGATGVLYAMMMLTALGFPDAEISPYYPPSWSLPLQWCMSVMLVFDVVGIWRGWKFFDHFAHLAGAAFAAIYYNYGTQLWIWLRINSVDEPPSKSSHPSQRS
ncbi:unnamed protein product, partial [Mycena citricolor]